MSQAADRAAAPARPAPTGPKPAGPAQKHGRSARKATFDRGAFYRLSRMLHAYLSAFAFLALMFFAATGLLLDHPDWLQGAKPAERETTVRLPAAELAAALRGPDASRVLAAAVGRRTPLLGAYKSAEVEDGAALIHLEGVRGESDIDLDTRSGLARVTLVPATPVTVVGELHRGRKAGAAWRWVIDVSAVVILLLSLVGYVLFFSLRFRLRTSLLLTATSLLALAAVFLLLTP